MGKRTGASGVAPESARSGLAPGIVAPGGNAAAVGTDAAPGPSGGFTTIDPDAIWTRPTVGSLLANRLGGGIRGRGVGEAPGSAAAGLV